MEIKKENVLKAHENGCEDVRKVLESLFPDVFEDKYNEDIFYSFECVGKNIITKIDRTHWAAIGIDITSNFWDNRFNSLKECIDYYISEHNVKICRHKTFTELLNWLKK